MSRVRREQRTVEAMVRLHCGDRHGAEPLCPACAELLAYAEARAAKCPFGEAKSTCGKCTVHCYRPEMREKIREVMRYAGPRMLRRHPVLALLHLLDGLRRTPPLPEKKRPAQEP